MNSNSIVPDVPIDIPIWEGCLPKVVVETADHLPWYLRLLREKPKAEIIKSIVDQTIDALDHRRVRQTLEVHLPVEKIRYLEQKIKEVIHALVHDALKNRRSVHTRFPYLESSQDPRNLNEKTCLGALNVYYTHPNQLSVFLFYWLRKAEHNIQRVIVPLVHHSDSQC